MTTKTTVIELSNLLGLTQRRVEQLTSDGTIPAPDKQGRLDLGQAVRSYVTFLKSSKGGSLAEARRDKVLKESELLDIELAEKKRTLIPVRDVAGQMSRAITSIRAHILACANVEAEDKAKILLAIKDLWVDALTNGKWKTTADYEKDATEIDGN